MSLRVSYTHQVLYEIRCTEPGDSFLFTFYVYILAIFVFLFWIFQFFVLYFIYAQNSLEGNKRLSVLCNKLLSAFDRGSTTNLHSSTISSVSVVMRAYLDPTDIQSLAYVSKAVFLSMWSMFWVECMIVWKQFHFHFMNRTTSMDIIDTVWSNIKVFIFKFLS